MVKFVLSTFFGPTPFVISVFMNQSVNAIAGSDNL